MRRLGGLTGSALLALCILGAAACGDDDKKPETGADGGLLTGGDGGLFGIDGSLLPKLDGAIISPDGAILAQDGAIIGQVGPDMDTGVTGGPDASPPVQCPGGCDDGADCTIDRCVDNTCTHSIDNTVCTGAASCTLQGCKTSTKTCANNMDCADMDGCTTNERCDTTLAVCKTDVLDHDGDGNPPVSCGGTDCNDNDGQINKGDKEACDGLDNDCDGTVDDGATCGSNETCTMGDCACAAGFTRCNGVCVDLMTDPNHCGACNVGMGHPDVTCGSAGICTAGACSCPATGTACGMGANATCSDIKTSQDNCGGCNMPCNSTVQQPRSCFDGACTACGNDGQACCAASLSSANPVVADKDGCYGALSCTGTQGTATSKCGCGAGATQCQGVCTDTKTDYQNCGACGKTCQGLQTCQAKGDTAACVACGGVGEPCCALGISGIGGACTGGATVTCNTTSNTCVRRTIPTPGPVTNGN